MKRGLGQRPIFKLLINYCLKFLSCTKFPHIKNMPHAYRVIASFHSSLRFPDGSKMLPGFKKFYQHSNAYK